MKLADIGGPTEGEQALLEGLSSGVTVPIGGWEVPDADAGQDRVIRAQVLRAVILGQVEDAPQPMRLHEKGVQLCGALITGCLDLEGCTVPRDLALFSCRFDTAPLLRSARLEGLFLSGSHLPGIEGDRLATRGGVVLRDATVSGTVLLLGAEVGGDFSCTNSAFTAGADGIAIGGDGMTTRGVVFLRDATVSGTVRLVGAEVGGDLVCQGAQLDGLGSNSLDLDGAHVKGTLFFRGMKGINGALDLTAARIKDLSDQSGSWPSAGDLLLDRCEYGAFIGTDINAEARIRWLDLQDEGRWGKEFWPQPWEHCAKVLREMGHREDARKVLIAKEVRQRAAMRARHFDPDGQFNIGLVAGAVLAGASGLALNANWVAPVFVVSTLLMVVFGWRAIVDWLLAVTVRYGHRPLLAVLWLVAFTFIGAVIFGLAGSGDQIKPNTPVVLRADEWVACAGEASSQRDCFEATPKAASYPRFNALIYSVDTLLPIVDLEMQGYWIPDETAGETGLWARRYLWLHIALGWALSLLAVAGFSGLIRSDSG